ncbi:MAG: hypothetical protein FWF12_07645 [Betaproteobacteria bacterium]|nr:hypothetical protein [Betaproteobacteria bacterium]
MKIPGIKGLRRYARQAGQGMAEYIIIVAVIAISSIFVYTQFGDVLRNQTAAGAKALAGQSGEGLTAAAQNAADLAAMAAMDASGKGMGDFASPGRGYGSPGGGGGGGDGGGDGGSPGGGGGPSDGLAGDMVPPPPVTPGPTIYASPLDDPAIQALIAKSPTLQGDIEKLRADGWEIVYKEGITGAGGATKGTKLIRINSEYRKNPLIVMRILAHEVGHARNDLSADWSSEDTFVRSNLLDEGEAVLYAIEIQRDILNPNTGGGAGQNIGLAGTSAYHGIYNGCYDDLESGKITREAAREEIAGVYKIETVGGKTYDQYYREQYQKPSATP